MMTKLLHNQVALVTGGTAGIGKAIALKFAQEGAKVAIFGTNVSRGTQAVTELQQSVPGCEIVFFQVDVADTKEVDEAIQKASAALGPIDILVNNAGITKDQLLMKMSEQDWDSVMDTNVKSCYNTSRSLVRSMMKAKKGRIINISSVVGLMGNAGQANYAASKAAMVGFTKALAKELASRNICVNCIAPGFISTAMTDALTDSQKDEILSKIPLNRFGSPDDIAQAAVFLASSMGNYITGQVLTIDGGMFIGA